MKLTEALNQAEVLAKFANLGRDDSAAVDHFRNYYPEFAPSDWWDALYRMDGSKVLWGDDVDRLGKLDKNDPNYAVKVNALYLRQWQYTQKEIRKAWDSNFKLTNPSALSDLLNLVFHTERPAGVSVMWNSSQLLLPGGVILNLNTKVFDFHKAVLYLYAHPKQAKKCEECGKYFVHVHGKRTLCLYPDEYGDTCSQKRIRQDKRDWWRDSGSKQRRANKKAEQKRSKISRKRVKTRR